MTTTVRSVRSEPFDIRPTKNHENNPMHSSRPLDGIAFFWFYEIDFVPSGKTG